MSNNKDYMNMDLLNLSQYAQNGDLKAFDVLQVKKHNAYVNIGDVVQYKKSDIEGIVKIKTTGQARLLDGVSNPVVPLEIIGDVLLTKIV